MGSTKMGKFITALIFIVSTMGDNTIPVENSTASLSGTPFPQSGTVILEKDSGTTQEDISAHENGTLMVHSEPDNTQDDKDINQTFHKQNESVVLPEHTSAKVTGTSQQNSTESAKNITVTTETNTNDTAESDVDVKTDTNDEVTTENVTMTADANVTTGTDANVTMGMDADVTTDTDANVTTDTDANVTTDTDADVTTGKTMSLNAYVLTTKWAWVTLYVFPTITVLGLLGNSLSLIMIIYRRLHQTSVVFLFLAFINGNELLYILMNPLVNVLDIYNIWSFTLDTNNVCRLRIYLVLSSSCSSAWLLVAANFFKVYALARPLSMVKERCYTASKITCSVITAFVFLGYIHIFWFSSMFSYTTNDGITKFACWLNYDDHLWYAVAFFPIFDMLVYSIMPGAILILTTVVMFVLFVRSYNRHKSIMRDGGGISQTFRSTKNTMLILVPVSTLFFLTTLPMSIAGCLINKTHSDIDPVFIFYLLQVFVDLNHSLNAYLQFTISSNFRNSLLGRASSSV